MDEVDAREALLSKSLDDIVKIRGGAAAGGVMRRSRGGRGSRGGGGGGGDAHGSPLAAQPAPKAPAAADGAARVYVGNLAYTVRDGDLQALFEGAGFRPLSCHVAMRNDGKSNGFGIVALASQEAADAAISALGETAASAPDGASHSAAISSA